MSLGRPTRILVVLAIQPEKPALGVRDVDNGAGDGCGAFS